MKVLITGGLGHIGSYLIENFKNIKKVKTIYIIDNFSTNRFSSLFNLPKKKKKSFVCSMVSFFFFKPSLFIVIN